MAKERVNQSSAEKAKLQLSQWSVHILDPLDSSAPTLLKLSETYGYGLRWFKSCQELIAQKPWESEEKAIYFLSDKIPQVTSLELIYKIADATSDQAHIFVLTEDLNANFREVSKLAGVVGWLPTPMREKALINLFEEARATKLWRPTRGQVIRFSPKIGVLNLSWTGSKLLLQGVMDDKALFGRIAKIVPRGVTTLHCDWSGVLTLNLEGLKAWSQFCRSKEAAHFQFVFERVPRMMQEFWESMSSTFGENVRILDTVVPNFEPHHYDPDVSLEDSIRTLLTEGRLRENAAQKHVGSLNHMYLRMLLTLSRYALSELYLTREAVLDLSSRLIARCSAVLASLEFTNISRTFELPGRNPLIPSLLALYEPLLRTLVGTIELLEAAAASHSGSSETSPLATWMAQALESPQAALPWRVEQLGALQQALASKVEGSDLILVILQLARTAIESNLSTIDATGVTAFKLAKLEGPSPQVLANLCSQLRRAEIASDQLQPFRHHCVLDWTGVVSTKAMAAEASKLLLGTALEGRKIGQVLDMHDTLQQIFDHRKLELDRLVGGANLEEIQEHLRKQAVTVLEKKVIGLYFKELAGLGDESSEMSGLQMFSES